ncbi:hypothetical protein GOBAR_AA00764 [Gossypium barbadense]|uniref:Arabinogalactan peptide 20 n=1 Tax=Gossypium barbadense TaxID=3634 RepID=A0A2P5YW20_GOSBA|nr:hypothetical protein GOBAR_AA00764 [Gossypium barbadense]
MQTCFSLGIHLLLNSSFLSTLPFSTATCYALVLKRKPTMTTISSSTFLGVAVIFGLVFASMSPYVEAQSASPAPSPTSDGTSIDQGIAYVLMVVALVLTYLIHPLDSSSYTFF